MTDPAPPAALPTEASDAAAPMADADAVIGAAPGKPLTDGARRALQEAVERRAAIDAATAATASVNETGGPAGLDPTRYGDWESKGVAIDFS